MGYDSKYNRQISGLSPDGSGEQQIVIVDVYDVLLAFKVECPAMQHAIKKLLCAGQRGKPAIQDLKEAKEAVERAIELFQILK